MFIKKKLLVFALFILFWLPSTPSYAQEVPQIRKIAVVMDNSDSMVREVLTRNGTRVYLNRWVKASYAFQTLINVSDQNIDQIQLYTMSEANPGPIYDNAGNDLVTPNNVKEMLAHLGVGESTSPLGTENAFKWASADAADERYVVILTDGLFSVTQNGQIKDMSAKESIDKVRTLANKYSNVSVIYVALDYEKNTDPAALKEELDALNNDPQFSVYYGGMEEQSLSIEDLILQVTDDIYQMKKLEPTEENLFRTEDSQEVQFIFDVDIPLERLVIIAQADKSSFLSNSQQVQDVQVIESEEEFNWADDEGIRLHNQIAPNFYIDVAETREKIQDPKDGFEKKCFIKTYENPQGSILLSLPKLKSGEEYIYKIYYVLPSDLQILPVVVQDGVTLARENGTCLLQEGETKVYFQMETPDGKVLNRDSAFIQNLADQIELAVDGKISAKSADGKGWDLNLVYNIDNASLNEIKMQCRYEAGSQQTPEVVGKITPDLNRYTLSIPQNQQINLDTLSEKNIIEVHTNIPFALAKELEENVTYKLVPLPSAQEASDEKAVAIDIDSIQSIRQEDCATYHLQVKQNEKSTSLFLGTYRLTVTLGVLSDTQNMVVNQQIPTVKITSPETFLFFTRKSSNPVSINLYIDEKELILTDAEQLELDKSLQNGTFQATGIFKDCDVSFNNGSLKIKLKNPLVWLKLLFGEQKETIYGSAELLRNGNIVPLDYTVELSGKSSARIPLLLVFSILCFFLIEKSIDWGFLLWELSIGKGPETFPLAWRLSSSGGSICTVSVKTSCEENFENKSRGFAFSPSGMKMKVYLRMSPEMVKEYKEGAAIEIVSVYTGKGQSKIYSYRIDKAPDSLDFSENINRELSKENSLKVPVTTRDKKTGAETKVIYELVLQNDPSERKRHIQKICHIKILALIVFAIFFFIYMMFM